MKNAVLLSAAVALSLALPSAGLAAAKPATAAHAHVHAAPKAAPPRVAPLDEYFGRMKLSPLGINNTIHDTSLRVSYDKANPGRYYQGLEFAEDALRDWARKYPQDTWLPGRAYFLSHVFWQMHTPQADAAADRCRSLLFKQFPKSRWANIAKHEIKEKIAPVEAASTQTEASADAGKAAGKP